MSFINTVRRTGDNIELYKYDGQDMVPGKDMEFNSPDSATAVCFLDVETTGIDRSEDKIIELAAKLILIDVSTGNIIGVSSSYESFQDPGQPIEEEISLINGITDDMVAGKSIQWDEIENIFDQSDIIAAHNASFDRAFLDRYLPVSRDKLWACTMSDIDWLHRGFPNNKQELLCIWHGFYYDSHRAMNDVDALIHLVTHPHYVEDKPILELITRANIPYYKIIARHCPYDLKDRVKANNYWWDGKYKYWYKRVEKEEIEDEKQWLVENIYFGYFRGIVEEIPLIDKYKD